MTITQILAVLRRRWSAVVIGLLIGLAAAAVTTYFLPKTYAATTSLYVRATDSGVSSTSYTGNLLTQQLVKSYADLATSQRVLNGVVEQLGLDRSADDLAGHVDAEVQQDSTILDITVTDGSPEQAARLTGAVGEQLIGTVTQIEQAGTYSVAFSTVDRPVADTTPVSPRWPINLSVGAALGLLLGIVLAVLLTAADTSMRSTRALAAAAGAPSLGVLPRERRARRDGSRRPGSSDAYVDAVRRLRTVLLLAEAGTSSPVVTVAGTRAGVGTTTLVRALAVASAPSRRVLLIEGDVRHPAAAADLGLDAPAGLTEVLAGAQPLDTAVRPWEGVDVLVAGAAADDAAAVLSTPALRQLIDTARASYDLVLVDAPSLGQDLDGVLLARTADATLLVARAGATRTDEVAAAVEALHGQGVRPAGTVLTGATRADDRGLARPDATAVPATRRPAAGTPSVLDPA